jgi:hypothetical protein
MRRRCVAAGSGFAALVGSIGERSSAVMRRWASMIAVVKARTLRCGAVTYRTAYGTRGAIRAELSHTKSHAIGEMRFASRRTFALHARFFVESR